MGASGPFSLIQGLQFVFAARAAYGQSHSAAKLFSRLDVNLQGRTRPEMRMRMRDTRHSKGAWEVRAWLTGAVIISPCIGGMAHHSRGPVW